MTEAVVPAAIVTTMETKMNVVGVKEIFLLCFRSETTWALPVSFSNQIETFLFAVAKILFILAI